jgi:hypothetical protein
MNERIKQLAEQAGYKHPDAVGKCEDYAYFDHEKFAELLVQDCADFVRENYDHEAAESIAWCMEIKYGLHGDYA